ANSRPHFSFPSRRKRISPQHFSFSSPRKAISPQHFAFPPRRKAISPQHFAFPPRQKRFPGQSFPLSSSETSVLARRNHREFEFPGCIGRCVYAKADAVPRILSAQAAIGTFEGIVMAFCGRSSCVRFPYITGGQR